MKNSKDYFVRISKYYREPFILRDIKNFLSFGLYKQFIKELEREYLSSKSLGNNAGK